MTLPAQHPRRRTGPPRKHPPAEACPYSHVAGLCADHPQGCRHACSTLTGEALYDLGVTANPQPAFPEPRRLPRMVGRAAFYDELRWSETGQMAHHVGRVGRLVPQPRPGGAARRLFQDALIADEAATSLRCAANPPVAGTVEFSSASPAATIEWRPTPPCRPSLSSANTGPANDSPRERCPAQPLSVG